MIPGIKSVKPAEQFFPEAVFMNMEKLSER